MQALRTSVQDIPSKAGQRIETLIDIAKKLFIQSTIIGLTLGLVGFVSTFMYGTFYFAFVPSPEHQGNVYPTFDPCVKESGRCGFLNGTVPLHPVGRPNAALLMTGQPYTFSVDIDMPESYVNRNLGMFLTCLQLKNGQGKVIRENCKSAMMQYRSELLRTLETLVFSPILMLRTYSTERQQIHVEFFNDFMDDPLGPAVSMDFQIKSRHIEVYGISYKIHANFYGLRYLMFHYPLVSAFVGTGLNFWLLSAVLLLSWYRFFSSNKEDEDDDEDNEYLRTFREAEEKALVRSRVIQASSSEDEVLPTEEKEYPGKSEDEKAEKSTPEISVTSPDPPPPTARPSRSSSDDGSGIEVISKDDFEKEKEEEDHTEKSEEEKKTD